MDGLSMAEDRVSILDISMFSKNGSFMIYEQVFIQFYIVNSTKCNHLDLSRREA